MDPFAPGVDDGPAMAGSLGPTRACLWFCGAVYVILGLFGAPWAWFMFTLDPEIPDELAVPMGIGFAAVMLVLCGGIGALNIAAAVGLGSGRRWAWVVAIVLGGMYVTSACLPFGAIMLYQLLQEDVRKAYLG